MKIQKYRRGIKQKGKFWVIPDNWKGPFGPLDNPWFDLNPKSGEWSLSVNIVRNDGDGEVEIIDVKTYKLPKWLQQPLQEVYNKGMGAVRHNLSILLKRHAVL